MRRTFQGFCVSEIAAPDLLHLPQPLTPYATWRFRIAAYNQGILMVRDGIFYGLGCAIAAALLGYFAGWWALVPILLGAFFLWFFRDPERPIPSDQGLVVSPADGKVTHIAAFKTPEGESKLRISIFLNVFNVHVNRSPIAGVIKSVEYRKGKFGNAMGAVSSEANEQNIVTVEGEGQTLVYKQIAGLLARRIVFAKRVGDQVARGERVGMIKFGSRVDVILPTTVEVRVKLGDHVAGGSSILGVNRSEAATDPGLKAAQ
jgi:phosphatidylserine decarboxylase